MARVNIIIGLVLCGLSALAMIGTTQKMPALFIPMMYGIPLLFLGVVALNPHRRRISTAVAAALMLFATVGSFARCGYGVALANQDPIHQHPEIDRYAVNLAIATTAISALYLVIYAVTLVPTKRRKQQYESRQRPTPSVTKPTTNEKRSDDAGNGSVDLNDHRLNLSKQTSPELDAAGSSSAVREFTTSPDP